MLSANKLLAVIYIYIYSYIDSSKCPFKVLVRTVHTYGYSKWPFAQRHIYALELMVTKAWLLWVLKVEDADGVNEAYRIEDVSSRWHMLANIKLRWNSRYAPPRKNISWNSFYLTACDTILSYLPGRSCKSSSNCYFAWSRTICPFCRNTFIKFSSLLL